MKWRERNKVGGRETSRLPRVLTLFFESPQQSFQPLDLGVQLQNVPAGVFVHNCLVADHLGSPGKVQS